MRITPLAGAFFAVVPAAALALLLAGCGGSSNPGEEPKRIPVVNPDPKDPRAGITLENEAQNVDRIRPRVPGR